MSITISTLERALLECLYLAPHGMDVMECYHLVEGSLGLRPQILQELLEHCTSIKVKRLFLYMAQKANHDWFTFLDTTKITTGKGKRSITKNGIYDAQYKITVPPELATIR